MAGSHFRTLSRSGRVVGRIQLGIRSPSGTYANGSFRGFVACRLHSEFKRNYLMVCGAADRTGPAPDFVAHRFQFSETIGLESFAIKTETRALHHFGETIKQAC